METANCKISKGFSLKGTLTGWSRRPLAGLVLVVAIVLVVFVLGIKRAGFAGKYEVLANYFNGIASPVIALLAAWLVYVAFREQVRANKSMLDIQQASTAVEQTRQFLEYLQATFARMRKSQEDSAEVIKYKFSLIYNFVKLNPDMITHVRSIVNSSNMNSIPFKAVESVCALLSLNDDELQHVHDDLVEFYMRRNGEMQRLLNVMSALEANSFKSFQLALIYDAINDGIYSVSEGMGGTISFLRNFEYPHPDSWLPHIKKHVGNSQKLWDQFLERQNMLHILAYESKSTSVDERKMIIQALAKQPEELDW